jgi:hypothetical protein
MIIEFGIAAGLVYGVKWVTDRTKKIRKQWDETLAKCRIEGIRNMDNETFELGKIYPKDYGYLCTVSIREGLSVAKLESAKDVLQDNLKCSIEISIHDSKDYIVVKLIYKDVNNGYFKPVKTKPNEIYLGNKSDGSPYLMDLNKDTHLLILGANGTGKDFLLASMLTNLFYHNRNDFEVWGGQNEKNDIEAFEKLFRFTATNLDDIQIALGRISNIIEQRNKEFASLGIRNISQFNKLYPKQKKKRIIYIAGEMSFLMPQEHEDEKVQGIKKECLAHITTIAKAGRSCGVHAITIVQRGTITNLPSDIKQQLSKCCLKMKSELDSRNAIDIPDAKDLKQREFIFDGNSEVIKLKVPKIDEEFKVLNGYVPEIKIPSTHKEEKKDGQQAVVRKAYFAGALKEIETPIISKLTYEESQKLSTYSECITLENKPAEQPQEELKEVVREIIEEASKETKSKKPRKRPSGTVRKEIKEVAISETNR